MKRSMQGVVIHLLAKLKKGEFPLFGRLVQDDNFQNKTFIYELLEVLEIQYTLQTLFLLKMC